MNKLSKLRSKAGGGRVGKIATALSISLLFPFITGFKSPSHLATANQTMDLLKQEVHPSSASSDELRFEVDGKILLVPVNSKTAYRAIIENAEFFRAGAIGPDGFSDLASGQMFEHGNESASAADLAKMATGGAIAPVSFLNSNPPTPLEQRTRPSQYRSVDFAMLMLAKYKEYVTLYDLLSTASPWSAAPGFPKALTQKDKDQILAFIMGYFSHLVGDGFAHYWVNKQTDGAWDFKNGQGMFNILTEEFKHGVVEGLIDSKVPGALENANGSENGQYDRFSIRIPTAFLDYFYSSRNQWQGSFGDRESSSPMDFFKYYSNTDQFHGGVTYNYFNLQVDVGHAAERWAYIKDVLDVTDGLPTLPSGLEDLLLALDYPNQLLADLTDWAEGDLLSALTGMDCNFLNDASALQTFLGVYNFLATFDTRIDGYTEKARVSRQNWLKLSQCTSENLARINSPAYNPAAPTLSRDACTVLAQKAASGIWADNAPDGEGLVRGSVTDQAWLNQTIKHFKGEFTPFVATLANEIGEHLEANKDFANKHAYLPALRQYLYAKADSAAYEPNDKHHSTIQNVIRQVEWLFGPGFLMDDFKDTLVASEFGPVFKNACASVRKQDVRECVDAGLRLMATAYEASSLGSCAVQYGNCRSAGIAACASTACYASCMVGTIGFGDSLCKSACGSFAADTCKAMLGGSCPQICLIPGCKYAGTDVCVPDGSVGLPCAAVPYSDSCCVGGLGIDPGCGSIVGSICNFDVNPSTCASSFFPGCEAESADCTYDKAKNTVDALFADKQYGKEFMDTFQKFCDAVEDPLGTIADLAIENKDKVLEFAQSKQQILGAVVGGVGMLLYMQESWANSTPEARYNAAFVNEDVARNAQYKATLRDRAATKLAGLVANPTGPLAALQIAGLTSFIAALDRGDPMVVQVDMSAAGDWATMATITANNVDHISRMGALIQTGVFEGISGPALITAQTEIGANLPQTFDTFYNVVEGMKLVGLDTQADIQSIFKAAGYETLALWLPWKNNVDLYSAACSNPDTVNLYCDVLVSNDDPSCMNCPKPLKVTSSPAGYLQADNPTWTQDRGVIAFNEGVEFATSGDHVRTYFPLATSDLTYEKVYKRIFRVPTTLPATWGFEGPDGLSNWTVGSGSATLTLDQTNRTQGANSLAMRGCNTFTVVSKAINTAAVGVYSNELSVDVWIPAGTNTYDYGQISAIVDVRAANLNSGQLGSVTMNQWASYKRGAWNTVKFQVPQYILDVITKDYPRMVLSFQLVLPQEACNASVDTYKLDNIRFTGNVLRRTVVHQVGSEYLTPGFPQSSSLLSFESLADWTPSSTLSADTTLKSKDNQSAKVLGTDYRRVVTNQPFTQMLASTVGWINIDVYLPKLTNMSDYSNMGSISLELNCDNGAHSAYLGPNNLDKLFEGEFNDVTFPITADMRTAIGQHPCTVAVIVNTPSTIPPVNVDNIFFTSVTPNP